MLDTTVLVYATGGGHRFRESCRELIAAIAAGDVEATTTVEVVQEFVHVRARRRGRGDAAALGNEYADLLAPLLSVTDEDLRVGLDLFGRSARLGAFDAVLTAAAISAGATSLISADAAFADADLDHIVPDVAGVRSLLAS